MKTETVRVDLIDGLHILTFTFPDFEADVILDANPRLMASRLINLARTIEKAWEEAHEEGS